MRTTKIAFSGIGAIGGYYGGLMAARYQHQKNTQIYFNARGENLKAIQTNKLTIRYNSQEILAFPTLATDQPTEIGPVDYLFCCTKSYDLEESLIQLKPIIDSHTIIIALQNGVDTDCIIHKVLPGQTVWKGCVYIGARLTSPGVIHRFSEKEKLFFGGDTKQKQQKELLQLLTDAGINAFNPKDIELRIWKKFVVISTAATITSYYNLSIGQVIEQYYDIFLTLGKEIQKLASAKGIPLPEDIAEISIEAQKIMPKEATTSMHSDFIKGGKTELETLTGYVVKIAELSGIDVPTYYKMYNGLKDKNYPIIHPQDEYPNKQLNS